MVSQIAQKFQSWLQKAIIFECPYTYCDQIALLDLKFSTWNIFRFSTLAPSCILMCHFTNKLLTVMVMFVLVEAMNGGDSEDFLWYLGPYYVLWLYSLYSVELWAVLYPFVCLKGKCLCAHSVLYFKICCNIKKKLFFTKWDGLGQRSRRTCSFS